MGIKEELKDKELFSTIGHAKDYTQFLAYFNNEDKRECPFCDPLDTELNEVAKEVGSNDVQWRMWKNPFPLRYTEHHLIIAPKRHIVDMNDMTGEDWRSLSELLTFATAANDDGLNLPGGGIVMRWGDPSLNAGSIRHVHANVIVPNCEGEVRIPLAKDPAQVEEKREILLIWEKLRQAGVGCALTKEVLRTLVRREVISVDEAACVESRG